MLVNFNRLDEVFTEISIKRNDSIEGIVPIKHPDGSILYSYKIRIEFQYIIPKVKELENKIPKNIDRHLYPKDWSLCLGYPLRVLSFWINSNYDCLEFVNKMIIPFLANQYFFDRNGEWYIVGLNHDIYGKIEFYSGIFNIKDEKMILNNIADILNGKKYGRNSSCFCGSELKYKYCHLKRNLTQHEINLLKDDYDKIKSYLNSKNN